MVARLLLPLLALSSVASAVLEAALLVGLADRFGFALLEVVVATPESAPTISFSGSIISARCPVQQCQHPHQNKLGGQGSSVRLHVFSIFETRQVHCLSRGKLAPRQYRLRSNQASLRYSWDQTKPEF
jgi:hypothetical protein